LRSVIFRYEDIAALSGALSDTPGSLPLPDGESVSDGEWVLAIFEIGSRRRATAAAARGVRAAGDTHLEFERRDWERLSGFVAARSEHMRAARPIAAGGPTSSGKLRAAPELMPPVEPTPRSRRDDLPPSSMRGQRDEVIESTRIPFGARVLVIDENRGGSDELRAMLAEMGLVAELVTTTLRAEERIAVQVFDAIVIDTHASATDSRSFIEKLRADVRIAAIPVLLLSSKPSSRDVVDAFASGCDDFLPKPFRTPELAARIFGLLRRARMVRGAVGSSGR
jgi:two-component system phosphate regulon response regulator PhoB